MKLKQHTRFTRILSATSVFALALCSALLVACGGSSGGTAPPVGGNVGGGSGDSSGGANGGAGQGTGGPGTGGTGTDSGNGGGTGSGSGTTGNPASPAAIALKVNGIKVFIGQPVEIDLRQSGAAIRTLDPATTTWTTALQPEPNGLEVIGGAVLKGTPQKRITMQATIRGKDATGREAAQMVTIASLRRTTSSQPLLSSIDYLSETLPAWYADPAYKDANGYALANIDTEGAGNPSTNAGIALGRALFYDTRLSLNGQISCATCHVQALGFTDDDPLSIGAKGLKTPRNSMSLANVRYSANGRMFWDLHAPTLELQAPVPISSDTEMAKPMDRVVADLEALGFYGPLFQAAFGSPRIDSVSIGKAVAQFQRRLVPWHSKYDRALQAGPGGTPDFPAVFTQQEMRGRALFESVPAQELARAGLPPITSMGCSACHSTAGQVGFQGPQNIGLELAAGDTGATGAGDFKVPSLRNIERTAPYMHDGRFNTLEEVIRHFATGVKDTPLTSPLLREGNLRTGAIRRYTLSDEDVAALVAFMHTLTDEQFLADERFSDPFPQ